MKTLIMLLFSTSLFSQLEIEMRPILEFPKPKSAAFELVKGIGAESSLIYRKYVDKDNIYEFYRASDSTFLMIHEWSGKVVNRGFYKVYKTPLQIDTVDVVNAITYEVVKRVIREHELIKINEWNEMENDSTFFKGPYENNKRNGRWFLSRDGVRYSAFGEYENGKLTKLYNPRKVDLNNNLSWILDKRFYMCSTGTATNSNSKNIDVVDLKADPDPYCYRIGTYEFFNNGAFNYTHNYQFEVNMKAFHGAGTWTILDDGSIEIIYSNQIRINYEVDQLSEKELYLRQQLR